MSFFVRWRTPYKRNPTRKISPSAFRMQSSIGTMKSIRISVRWKRNRSRGSYLPWQAVLASRRSSEQPPFWCAALQSGTLLRRYPSVGRSFPSVPSWCTESFTRSCQSSTGSSGGRHIRTALSRITASMRNSFATAWRRNRLRSIGSVIGKRKRSGSAAKKSMRMRSRAKSSQTQPKI